MMKGVVLMRKYIEKILVLLIVLLLFGCSNFMVEVSQDTTSSVSDDDSGEDETSAVATISGDISSGSTTAFSEASFTVSWDQDVTGFTSGDISVSNGVLSDFDGSGSSYTFTIDHDEDSLITITISADVVNEGNEAVSFSYNFEADALTVTISSELGDSVNESTLPLTFTFSQSVSDFDEDDLTVSDGVSLDDFEGSGTDYSVDLVLSEEGSHYISLASGSVNSDIYSSVSNEASSFEFYYDGTSPTLTLSTTIEENATSGSSSLIFVIDFNEDVDGFESEDIDVDNGTFSSFSSSSDDSSYYEVTVIPTEDGEVTLTVPSDVCEDSYGNNNESASFSYIYDSSLVGATITSSDSDNITAEDSLVLTITFDDGVNDLSLSDFDVSSGALSNLDEVDGYIDDEDYCSVFTVDMAFSDEGDITITLDASSATDVDNRGNSAATVTLTYDDTNPSTPVFSLNENSSGDELKSDDYANEGIVLTLETDYSDDSGSDLIYEYTSDGDNYEEFTGDTLYFTEETTYEEINIVITDEAGNSATGTAITSLTLDLSSPVSPLVSIDTDPVNASNEDSFSFTLSDGEEDNSYSYTISDESGNEMTGSGELDSLGEDSVYSLDISGMDDGAITVQVTQSDLAGNTSGIGQDEVDKDTVVPDAPVVTITSDDTITSATNEEFSFTISGGEEDLTYNYSISSSEGTTTIEGSDEFDSSGEVSYSDIDLSAIDDGTLTVSVYQTDAVGNVSDTGTDSVTLDAEAVNEVDFSEEVTADNVDSYTFTIYGEYGSTYSYVITSSGGDTSLSGSGEFDDSAYEGESYTITETVDLTDLADGYLVLYVTLTDESGNISISVSVVAKSTIEVSTDKADFSGSSMAVSFDMSDEGAQYVDGETVKYNTYELLGSDYDDTIGFSDLEDGEVFTIDGGEGENTLDLSNYASYDVSLTAGENADGDTEEDSGVITVSTDDGGSAEIEYSNFQILEFSTYNFTGSPHFLELDTSDDTIWTFSDVDFSIYNPNQDYKIGLIEYAGSLDKEFSLATSYTPQTADDYAKWFNGHIIFDYQDEDNYKVISAYAGADTWNIYEIIDGEDTLLAKLSEEISNTEANYIELIVDDEDGMVAELWSDGECKITYTFEDVLNNGEFGISSWQAYSAFTINMTPSNWAPYVEDYDEVISYDDSITIDLLDDAFDYEGDSLSVSDVSEGKGHLTDNGNGTVTYTPGDYDYGDDDYTYTISDGTNETIGTIEIYVVPSS
jgi:hypothetical protein